MAIFSTFSWCMFRTFRVKAKLIRWYVVSYWFSTYLQIDDLEWPFCVKFCFWASLSTICVLWLLETTAWKQINTCVYCPQQKCSPVTLLYGNIRLMQIFMEFTGEGCQTTVGCLKGFTGIRRIHLNTVTGCVHYMSTEFSCFSNYDYK